jgi:hypothetical protein
MQWNTPVPARTSRPVVIMPEPKLAPPPTVWRDASVNLNVTAEVDRIIRDLDEALESKQEFEKKLPDVVEKRLKWLDEYNRDQGNVLRSGLEGHKHFVLEWQAREPGLEAVTEIVNARKRVADLEGELVQAKAELVEVESQGTPLNKYIKSLQKAETMVTSLSNSVHKQAKATVMLEHYGHAEESRLSTEAKAFVAMQPCVTSATSFVYRGAVTGVFGSEMLSAVQLKAAHDKVVDALLKLREMAK